MKEFSQLLRAIIDKFPGYKSRIEELYEQDAEFQTLCFDYLSCVKYLKESERSQDEALQTIEDYKELIQELEKEILQDVRR